MDTGKKPCVHTIFFHPDYTVGPGITPGHALRLAGCTAGGESHPALKILIQFDESIRPGEKNVKGLFPGSGSPAPGGGVQET